MYRSLASDRRLSAAPRYRNCVSCLLFSPVCICGVKSFSSLISEVRDLKEPCYDTSTLHWYDFSDWTGWNVTMEKMLRFVALHAHVIHREDPKVSFIRPRLHFIGSFQERKRYSASMGCLVCVCVCVRACCVRACVRVGIEHWFVWYWLPLHSPTSFEPPRGKNNIVVSGQGRHKPACTVTEAGQKLEILELRRGGIVLSE